MTGEFDFSNPNVAGRDSIIDRIDDLEDCLAGGTPQDDGGETTLHDAVGEDYTPIERLSVLGEDALDEHVSASDRRAVTLFEHWDEWSTKTPKGNLLKIADSLKSLLSTACDDRSIGRAGALNNSQRAPSRSFSTTNTGGCSSNTRRLPRSKPRTPE